MQGKGSLEEAEEREGISALQQGGEHTTLGSNYIGPERIREGSGGDRSRQEGKRAGEQGKWGRKPRSSILLVSTFRETFLHLEFSIEMDLRGHVQMTSV